MRGITPPRLGSVRDRVMTEMFVRERLLEHENFATLTLVLSLLIGAGEDKLKKIVEIVDHHRERQLYKHWMVETKKENAAKAVSDHDILRRLDKLRTR